MSGLDAQLGLRRGDFALDLRLAVAPGEVVALLGPNGAGKSTALGGLAGLLRLSSGAIRLGGEVLADATTGVHRRPDQRPIGVVFQDYLLFPHLTLLDNVAFGLTARGRPRAAARDEAARWLARMELTGMERARPRAVSGGQAQRVALARALAFRPELLLLDEPLAALDARTRLTVRGELRRHLTDFTGATLIITHDPVDAAVLADRLVVIEDGVLVQEGPPIEVTRRPRTDYVARLVGLNLLTGTGVDGVVRLPAGGVVATGGRPSGAVYAAFRPRAVALFAERPNGSPRNLWSGRIRTLEPHGEGVRVEVGDVPDRGSSVIAEITPAAVAELALVPGRAVWVAVKASEVEVYPRAD